LIVGDDELDLASLDAAGFVMFCSTSATALASFLPRNEPGRSARG